MPPDVPAIPEHALAAVSDPNAAIVLRALISGWYVRNGDTGQGAQRFVTAEEVGLAKGKSGGIPGRGLPGFSGGNSGISPTEVSRIINAAEAQVIESPLFIDLGTRLTVLDAPNGRVNAAFSQIDTAFTRIDTAFAGIAANGAAITTETTARADGDTALATSISVQAARVDNAEAAITSETTARVNADGALATSITAQGARIGVAEAAITSETTARVNGDTALATSISVQAARVDGAEAAILTETTARAGGDTALATSISVQASRVTGVESAITSEHTTRVNSDNALAEALNFIWTKVGDNSGLVTGGTEVVSNVAGAVATNWNQTQVAIRDPSGNIISSAAVRATAESAVSITGEINAKYTVKVDVNGYVAGYGLISTANNGTPTADFTVRADRFAVGSPSGPGIAPQVPFIVYTTPQVIGGQSVPAGMYVREAFIANGTIDSARIANAAVTTAKIADAQITRAKIGNAAIGYANIGDAEVGTLKIGGNAVTVMASATAGGGVSISNAYITVTTAGGPVFLGLTAQSQGAINFAGRIYRDGGLIATADSGGSTLLSMLWVDYPPAGSHQYRYEGDASVGGNLMDRLNAVALETRR